MLATLGNRLQTQEIIDHWGEVLLYPILPQQVRTFSLELHPNKAFREAAKKIKIKKQ